MSEHIYEVVVAPLHEEMGGGYIAYVPELFGCISDGESQTEALENLQDALKCWLEANEERGLETPQPGTGRQMVADNQRELEEYSEQREKLIRTQKELIEKLQERYDQLVSHEKERALSGWHVSASFEHPATSRRPQGFIKVQTAPVGPADVLHFPHD